jgi:hypothetical protein
MSYQHIQPTTQFSLIFDAALRGFTLLSVLDYTAAERVCVALDMSVSCNMTHWESYDQSLQPTFEFVFLVPSHIVWVNEK